MAVRVTREVDTRVTPTTRVYHSRPPFLPRPILPYPGEHRHIEIFYMFSLLRRETKMGHRERNDT